MSRWAVTPANVIDFWWSVTDSDLARQWPCAEWYHVPNNSEWTDALLEITWETSCNPDIACATQIIDTLLLSFNWEISYSDFTFNNWNDWQYWSSDTSFMNTGDTFRVTYQSAINTFYFPTWWLSVRCIKNP